MRPYCLLSLLSLLYRLIPPPSYIFDTFSSSSMGCSQTLCLLLKDRRASVFSINRSSSARMWIKSAGDLFTASARGCSLHALARSLPSRAVTLSKQKGNKNVYEQATSSLNCISSFSKEYNLFTNDSQSNRSTKFLNDLFFPFSVFIHWSLEYACQSHSISHSDPSLLQHLLLTLVSSTCLLLRAIPWCFCSVSYW